MGKKRFNAKGRQHNETVVDNSSTKNIKIDFKDELSSKGYDESNPLVLPSKKRKTKTKIEKRQITKILSKKQRKGLEKIVEKKKKKEQRASLLESLGSVQISTDELKTYTSISTIQTVGIKKLHAIQKLLPNLEDNKSVDGPIRVSSIAGRNKRKLLALLGEKFEDDDPDCIKTKKNKNLNIIGLDAESSENSCNSDSEIDQVQSDEMEESVPQLNYNAQKNEAVIEIKEPAEKLIPVHKSVSTPTTYVHVERTAEIQASRLKLPILAEEQSIMELINENPIVIVAGETGSGKTTQIPQFLYEAGYAEKKLIGITEPRRVAAIAMSKRVAKEMNLPESEVSYLIRFDGNVTDNTKIKFMTDGVLMKEVENDFLLNNYSVIILDEAHERSSYTDILIGLLSRIVPLRLKMGKPLKLIIMSATLKVEDFTGNRNLFKIPPPVVNVEARQFPVTIHFQKKTAVDYVQEAFKKTIKIHSKLPEGGILIFLTGQKEVKYLVKKLKQTFPYKGERNAKIYETDNAQKQSNEEHNLEDEFDKSKSLKKAMKKSKKKLATSTSFPKIDLDRYSLPNDHSELLESSNETEGEDDEDLILQAEDISGISKQPLWVLPLYSLLSADKQNLVFSTPPNGCRLCIVSTNVAETSLTIPNVKYVVDAGRQKTRLYDKVTGVSSFIVTFTSQASADQRAGRAGRTSAGHCYRLYSSSVYTDEFEKFTTPDIQKKPVDDLMLQMKCMGIDKVINFPFPSPPDRVQLDVAEQRLIWLGALEMPDINSIKDIKNNIAKVTKLGRAIAAFPVAPRFGKMLALSHQQDLLQYTVVLVAALSVQEVLIEIGSSGDDSGDGKNKWKQVREKWAAGGNFMSLGDPMVLLRAIGAAEYAGSIGKLEEFCRKNGLRAKGVTEIRKLRIQLTNEINLNLADVNICVNPQMLPPTDLQAKLLRQILLSGMGDRVARKLPENETKCKEDKRKLKYAYNVLDLEEPAFMHFSSVLGRDLPNWVIYQEAYETQNGDSTKIFIRGITAIEPEWLLTYAPKLCNIRTIKEDPSPQYNSGDGKIYCYVDATYGKAAWELPLAKIEMPFSEKACKFFGMFFLNGDIFPKLKAYKDKLKSTPSSLVKSWSSLNQFVTQFNRSLVSKQINSKAKLLEVWESDPNYLLHSYMDLLHDVNIHELLKFWPPIEH